MLVVTRSASSSSNASLNPLVPPEASASFEGWGSRSSKAKAAAGEYGTESEVIRDGLRTLLARDRAVDNGLRDEGRARL